jgi:hypothetical protein
MWRKIDAEESEEGALRNLHEQSVAEMLSDPELTEAEKQELLRQLEVSDEDWQPVELPDGAELVSETIIRLRQGDRP